MKENCRRYVTLTLVCIYGLALWLLGYGVIQLLRYVSMTEVTRWAYLSLGVLSILCYGVVGITWMVFRNRIARMTNECTAVTIVNRMNSFVLPVVALVLVALLVVGLLN